MQNRPIHENLDTSFVNLSALIKYLRRRQFVGSVKVQLNGYRADINLKEDNLMDVSEHDQISGRVSTGEEALQRLLIRAREPGGTINVFQAIDDAFGAVERKASESNKSQAKSAIAKNANEPIIKAEINKEIPKPVGSVQNSNGSEKPKIDVKKDFALPKVQKFVKPNATDTKINGNVLEIEKKTTSASQTPSLPDFPFRLTNKVEDIARKKQEFSSKEWQQLLNLTVELLGVIDKSLARANLDFTAAFKKASAEISDDYPFLNPASDKFEYANGKIKMSQQINPKIFVSSITESIRRILDKLETNQKFAETHRATVQTILAVMNKRQNYYDKYGITPQLKRILGA